MHGIPLSLLCAIVITIVIIPEQGAQRFAHCSCKGRCGDFDCDHWTFDGYDCVQCRCIIKPPGKCHNQCSNSKCGTWCCEVWQGCDHKRCSCAGNTEL